MRVAGIRATSAPVQTIDVPDPRPLAEDEVLIAVQAAGVGNWDEIARTGNWNLGVSPPMALGVEAAGIVQAAGRAVDRWATGDEVLTHPLPLREQGTWAPWLIAPARLLAEKPSGMPWDAAAAFPVPALIAEQTIREALDVQDSESVLVHGAGGVTGGLLVSIGAISGARVIATAGPSSRERVEALGADHVIDYHYPAWVERVLSIAGGGGVNAAANAVPGGSASAIRTVRDAGRFATITSDPPREQRGIRVSSLYVRPDGAQLDAAAALYGGGG